METNGKKNEHFDQERLLHQTPCWAGLSSVLPGYGGTHSTRTPSHVSLIRYLHVTELCCARKPQGSYAPTPEFVQIIYRPELILLIQKSSSFSQWPRWP